MSTVLWRPDVAAKNGVTASAGFDGSRTAVIVLAGSHAWNRSSIESILPRPLLPVADKPLIAHALRWLERSGAREATICTNGLTPLITEHLRHVPGLPFLTYQEDAVPRGPAGCAADALAESTAERLLIVEGSAIPALDFERLLREHRASGAAVTLVVQPSDRDPSVRRPAIPAGVYVFERSALGEVATAGYQDIKEMLLQRLHGAGHTIRLHEADGWCHQVVDTRTYLNVSQACVRQLCGDRGAADRPSENGGSPTQGVVASPTSRIDRGAVLIAPILLGPHCEIMAGATIVGPVAIGAHTTIHPGAVVSRSVIWDRCVIGPGALVDQSVVVHDMRVRAGARLVEALGMPRLEARFRRVSAPAPRPAWRSLFSRKSSGL